MNRRARRPGGDPLADAAERALAELARIVEVRTIAAGGILGSGGDRATECLLVASGEAGVFVEGDRVATAGPGDFVGELQILSHRPPSAVVRAATDMDVFVVSPVACRGLVTVPAVNRQMLRRLAASLSVL